jgi:adenylate kinase family enzyme
MEYPFHIVHISGSPGSGKSTIGDKIAAIFQETHTVVVVDTDDLIRNGSEEMQELDLLAEKGDGMEEYSKRWEEIFGGAIENKIRKAAAMSPPIKMLLFVGLLDQYAGPNQLPIEIKQVTHRFFIDIPLCKLVKHFYSRYCTHFGNNREFWDGVANEKWPIPSSTEFLADHRKQLDLHLARGYALAPPLQIFQTVLALGKQ